MPNTETNITEETEVQETQTEDNKDSSNAIGDPVTFEDIINHPDYKDDYQKAVDRAVSKAINSFKKNHADDIEKIVSEQVSTKVRDVKFNAVLKEKLKDAGVIDNTAFIAHLDMNKMKESFDEANESFNGFDELITSSKEKMPYLFKQEEPIKTTGQAQTSFGTGENKIKTLQDALHAKYKI